jgi:hypothetical protein
MTPKTVIDTFQPQLPTRTSSLGLRPVTIATLLALGMVACSPADANKSRAQVVINKGLEAQPECLTVNVGRRYEQTVERTSLALKALEAAKLVELGTIEEKSWGSNAVNTVPAYQFTEAGKSLVPESASASPMARLPCVRNGKFEVVSIEAIDINNDLTGRPIANVRARLRFLPENWFASTKTDPSWASYWSAMDKTEQTQWLYSLLKSGDELFFTGRGTALK